MKMKTAAVCGVVAALLTPCLAQAQVFSLTKEQLIEYTAGNPFERFPDGRPKVPDALIERAKGISMEEVFGVLPGKASAISMRTDGRCCTPAKRWWAGHSRCSSRRCVPT